MSPELRRLRMTFVGIAFFLSISVQAEDIVIGTVKETTTAANVYPMGGGNFNFVLTNTATFADVPLAINVFYTVPNIPSGTYTTDMDVVQQGAARQHNFSNYGTSGSWTAFGSIAPFPNGFTFSDGSGRTFTPDSSSWSVTGGFAPDLQSVTIPIVISGNISLVPEPEVHAMLLAGLGVLGLVLCRRNRREAAHRK